MEVRTKLFSYNNNA